ncbi:hypothetical protein ERJ75_000102100 [Trypanosoma vivax]|nr:hypothetical protein ERJ75_000102100 [Trypanosoma vivax]
MAESRCTSTGEETSRYLSGNIKWSVRQRQLPPQRQLQYHLPPQPQPQPRQCHPPPPLRRRLRQQQCHPPLPPPPPPLRLRLRQQQCHLLHRPPPPPSDLPNRDGNWSVLVNGYRPLWYNFTLSVLLSQEVALACPEIGKRDYLGTQKYVRGNVTVSPCLLRLSDSPTCNSVLLDVGNLTSDNTNFYNVTVTDRSTNITTVKRTVEVGPITLTGSLADGIHNITMRRGKLNASYGDFSSFQRRGGFMTFGNGTKRVFYKQVFMYVCFSTGAYSLLRCDKGPIRSGVAPLSFYSSVRNVTVQKPCTSSFYKALNADSPFYCRP